MISMTANENGKLIYLTLHMCEVMVTELVLHRPLNPLNELEALMLEFPDLAYRTVNASLSDVHITGVYHFTGGSASLEALKRKYIANPPPQASVVEILAERKGELLLYEQEKIGESPMDLSVHIHRELGPDVIFTATKGRDGVTWRMIVFHHGRIRPFLESVREMETKLDIITQEKLTWYHLKALRALTGPGWDEMPSRILSSSDEHILKSAWKAGFFSVPRRTDVRKLAGTLDFSPSGLSYRLRKAVQKVLGHYLGREL